MARHVLLALVRVTGEQGQGVRLILHVVDLLLLLLLPLIEIVLLQLLEVFLDGIGRLRQVVLLNVILISKHSLPNTFYRLRGTLRILNFLHLDHLVYRLLRIQLLLLAWFGLSTRHDLSRSGLPLILLLLDFDGSQELLLRLLLLTLLHLLQLL